MARIRAAIVGAGLIAGKKHIPAFLKHRNKVELAAICDVNIDGAQKVASAWGIPKAYAQLEDMLTQEKPELVDICTPPKTHAAIAVAAMRNGCNVLIEKPMALSVADCDTIVEAAKQYGVKVCVGHSDLFYGPFVRAREIVARGEIGVFRGMRIFLSTPTDYMTSQKDHWAHRLPGGVIGETGPHIVYMSLAFINPVRDVRVQGTKLLEYPWSQFEDYRIDLVGEKAISSVTLSYATNQWAAQVDILGSTGTLQLDLEGMALVRHSRQCLRPAEIGASLLSSSTQTIKNLVTNCIRHASGRLGTTHGAIISGFVDSIRSGTPTPVSAEEGRESVRVLNMIVDKLDRQHSS